VSGRACSRKAQFKNRSSFDILPAFSLSRKKHMPAVESQMLPLGTPAPSFTLPDPDGALHSLRNDAPATLVMFICNHCPFVVHVQSELARLGVDYATRGVALYAINSNDVITHPSDHPRFMKIEAERAGFTFPYLFDESQSVAKAYGAVCTPDFFLFDSENKLVYRGQLDDSRPSNRLPTDGHDLRAALDAVLASEMPDANQTPSIGCSIKWTAGNAPG
jgi:peroxiredoxin